MNQTRAKKTADPNKRQDRREGRNSMVCKYRQSSQNEIVLDIKFQKAGVEGGC